MITLLVLSIYLLVLKIMYISSVHINRLRRLYYVDKSKESSNNSSTYGEIILVDGPVKTGKTSRCSILVNSLILKLEQDILSMMELVKTLAPECEFNLLDILLDDSIDNDITDPDLLYDSVLTYEDFPFKECFKGVYYDGYLTYPKISYLNKYIEAYVRYRLKNYVAASIDFVDRIFFQKAENVTVEDFAIKDGYAKCSFKLEPYKIYFIDDLLTFTKMQSQQFQDFNASDIGFDITLRLIGHLFHKTTYFIANAQNANRVLIRIRELATTIIHVSKIQKKLTYSSVCRLLDKKLKAYYYLHRVSSHLHLFRNFFEAKYKYHKLTIHHKKDIYKSSCYLTQNTTVYHSISDTVGEPEMVVAPSVFAWGCCSSFYFDYVAKILKEIATLDFSKLTESELEVEKKKILQKYDSIKRKAFEMMIEKVKATKDLPIDKSGKSGVMWK